LEFSWKIQKLVPRIPFSSGEAKGGVEGAVRPWRHFYGGGTMGNAVGYKLAQAVLKYKWF